MNRRLHKPRRGVALVMVLWLMTVIGGVALNLSFTSRLNLRGTRSTVDATRALFLARAGVEQVIAELKQTRDVSQGLAELRETSDRLYSDVELGQGSYTLLVDPAHDLPQAEPEFGICDEAARLNVNTATAEQLQNLPGMDPAIAAAVAGLGGESEPVRDLRDLLLAEGMDEVLLFGEDTNWNGILDPWEDDGDAGWPPDNQDGYLARGLAAHLTCVSAARNVTVDGKERVNLNEADASELSSRLSGISEDQTESIVEHRKNNQFSTIADLLEVDLVRRSQGGGRQDRGNQSNDRRQNQRNQGGRNRRNRGGNQRTQNRNDNDTSAQAGGKAFSVEQFKSIADRVTTTDEGVLQGRVNLNTAPAVVLRCLPDVDEAVADAIVDRRAEADFQSVAELLDIAGIEEATFKKLCPLVTVRSDVFSVRSFGVPGPIEAQPESFCCVRAVIDRTEDTVRITSWRELD